MFDIETLEKELPQKTAKDIFLLTLGLDEIPETSEDLPNSIHLRHEVLGDLEVALLNTIEDDREREQLIGYDSGQREFKKSRLFVGVSGGVGIRSGLRSLGRTYFGQRAVFHFHIHDPGADEITIKDWVSFGVSPRESYMYGVATPFDLRVLVRTRESLKLPFSSLVSGRRIRKMLSELNGDDRDVYMKEAEIAEKLGFGYFLVRNSHQEDDDSWHQGDFAEGLILERVRPK
jgi:hypothetical protein